MSYLKTLLVLIVFGAVYYLNGYIFVTLCALRGVTDVISMAAVSAGLASTLLTMVIVGIIICLAMALLMMFLGVEDDGNNDNDDNDKDNYIL